MWAISHAKDREVRPHLPCFCPRQRILKSLSISKCLANGVEKTLFSKVWHLKSPAFQKSGIPKVRCSKFTVKCIYDCLFWHDTGPVKFTTKLSPIISPISLSCRPNQWIRTCLKCLKSGPKPHPLFDLTATWINIFVWSENRNI